jgi:hypothetical protein
MTLKKKVEVEGLGRVTQPLRTTVPRGYGQTPIQVEKATPLQETGIGKLSQALGLAVQIGSQVKQIGDIKEEEVIQDLASKPPEEIDKELSNNKGQFDKAHRNGLIPFTGNPWNQERVQKASGALLGDTFEVKLQEAFNKAPYNSDADSIVNDVIAEMSEEHSRLSTPAAHDGFREAIRGTIQQYKLSYNNNKNAQNKSVLYTAGKSELVKAFTPRTIRNERGEDEDVTDIAKAANWWKDNEGAFLPQEKLKMIKEVGVAIAKGDAYNAGDADAARTWAQWAGGHLKIGTALMGDPTQTDDDVFNAYSSETADLYRMIDTIEKQNEGKAKGDAALLLTEIDSKVTADTLALASGNIPKDEEGNLLDTKEKIEDYYIRQAQASDNVYVRSSSTIQAIRNAIEVADLPPEEHILKLKSNIDQLYNRGTGHKTFGELLNDTDETLSDTFLLDNSEEFLDDMSGKPTEAGQRALIGLQNLANSVRQEIASERMDKLRELSSGSYVPFGSDEVKTSSDLQGVVAKDMRAWDKHFSDEYKRRYNDKIIQYRKEVQAGLEVQAAAPTSIENAKSYVFPNQTIADAKRSSLTFQNNFANLEEHILNKDLESAKVVAADLEKPQYDFAALDYFYDIALAKGLPYGVPRFTTTIPVVNMLNKLKNAESTTKEKNQARKALAVYAIGKGVYTADNIRNGEAVVRFGAVDARTEKMNKGFAEKRGYEILDTQYPGNVVVARIPGKTGREITIPINKEAVRKMLSFYPILPRERLLEIQQNPKTDVTPELDLYNSIFDTNYTEDDEGIQKIIGDFVEQQMKVTTQ